MGSEAQERAAGRSAARMGAQVREGSPAFDGRYHAFDLTTLHRIPQLLEHVDERDVFEIEVVGRVFPFKTNNYVVDELIDWGKARLDPMYLLNFPRRGMLKPDQYDRMAEAVSSGDARHIEEIARSIRSALNPHPAGQWEHNVPSLRDQPLRGMQHKYPETVLFFPSQAQTCHAYCSFCFRWPQFIGDEDLRFATNEVEGLIEYLRNDGRITDVLFTGGDPMIMSPKLINAYLEPLIEADLPNLRTIRMGSKSLSYWPYKFVTDQGHEGVLDIFRRVVDSGLHLAFMAHFNHPVELSTPVAKLAIRNIRSTGAVIRSQTPLLRNINDDPALWAEKWRAEVNTGVIPYYMFVVRDTGAQDHFGVPLVRAWRIFRDAYQKVSGLARTVRGPSMSAEPGKIEVTGVARVAGDKVLALRFLQGRNPDWACRPFYAQYDEEAIWLDGLTPAFGAKEFFFEPDLRRIYAEKQAKGTDLQKTFTAPQEA